METTSPSKKSVSPFQFIIQKQLIGRSLLAFIALLAFWKLATSFQQNPTLFIQQVINGLQLGFVYALIALGYTMVYGIVRLINFAHGDVFMVGAFVSYYLISWYRMHEWIGRFIPGMPFWISIIVGMLSVILIVMAVCALMAVTIERIAYKPLREAPRISALITAIGVSFFLEYFGALPFVFGPNFTQYERPFAVSTWVINLNGIYKLEAGLSPEPGSLIVSNIGIIIIITSISLLLLLNFLVKKTKTGKAMRAVAYDKQTARLMGIQVNGIISVTFAVGAALAGTAGILFAIAYPQVRFGMGIIPGLKAFVAAVLGGIGSIPGAVVGSLIMGQTEVLSAAYISTPMRDAIAFSILILVLLVRPTGIFGEPTREKA